MSTSSEETKRLFFALEVAAPWPEAFPKGRLLEEGCRHMTLAFLGQVPYDSLKALLPQLPLPSFQLGPVGRFDRCLFLPQRRPRVVAWEVHWYGGERLLAYQKLLSGWLRKHGCSIEERLFLSHVTLARWPFDKEGWSRLSYQLPMIGRAIHLYESLGNLRYEPRWSFALTPVFEEISHTADLAFKIRGENNQQLFLHAQLALAFSFPPFLSFVAEGSPQSIEEIILELNGLVSRADAVIGVPFKAVSYHGNVVDCEGVLEWEMIVDV